MQPLTESESTETLARLLMPHTVPKSAKQTDAYLGLMGMSSKEVKGKRDTFEADKRVMRAMNEAEMNAKVAALRADIIRKKQGQQGQQGQPGQQGQQSGLVAKMGNQDGQDGQGGSRKRRKSRKPRKSKRRKSRKHRRSSKNH